MIDAKEYYGINCIGGFWVQRLETLPVFTPEDQGREVFVTSTGRRYVGGLTDWVEFQMGGSDVSRWPEIFTPDNTLLVTVEDTRVLIPANKNFMMRGALYNTDAVPNPKSFNTTTNHTYHLRFVHNAVRDTFNMKVISPDFYSAHGIESGQFYLADLAETTPNSGYNPSNDYDDKSAVYDSRRDDMLVAKVVNQGGVVTVTHLKNAHYLFAEITVENTIGEGLDHVAWTHLPSSLMTLNWARRPVVSAPTLSCVKSWLNPVPETPPAQHPKLDGAGAIMELAVRDYEVSRYSGRLQYAYADNMENLGYVTVHWFCQA